MVYLTSFFSLPVKRSTGERLTHDEVVHRLDSDTVSYESTLGVSGVACELMRVSIKVETAAYETAIAWLKDLVYGSEFDKERYVCCFRYDDGQLLIFWSERLQVTFAKIQQSLPESKRDGSTVLASTSADLLFDETSTSRMSSVIPQLESIPRLAQQLQESPAEIIKDMEEIRRYSEIDRFSKTWCSEY